MVSRRLVMQGMVGLVAAATGRSAAAANGARKVIFVHAVGGWDPLTVFAPILSSPDVDPNDGGVLGTAGGIRFVDHPDRPTVRSFFERWHASTAIVNGISVPSLSHDVCTRLVWTGRSGEGRADWPSTVGAMAADDYTLPSLVISGPSFPEEYGVTTARAGADGQLADLIDGSIVDLLDRYPEVDALPLDLRAIVDRRVQQRAGAWAAGGDPLAAAFAASLDRALLLTTSEPLDLRSTATFDERAGLAVEALRRGVSRTVTFEADGSWDTHTNNDGTQSFLFEGLFDGLTFLLEQLGDLLEETTVVVLSEMGRTPKRNLDGGRDHWPYTTAMLVGAGVRGDQVISGFDDGYFALPYDAATGEASGVPLTAEHLGATLLALADVDPAEHLPPEISPIVSVIG